MRSIGKRDCGNLFKLGDDMIAFQALHHLLAASVADMLPVNVSVLLCDEAKKLARQGNSRGSDALSLATVDSRDSQPGSKTFEGLMSSPWKVRLRTLCTPLALTTCLSHAHCLLCLCHVDVNICEDNLHMQSIASIAVSLVCAC